MPEIVNALYFASIAAGGLIALAVAFTVLLLIVMVPFAGYAWIKHKLFPPPDRTAEALRKLAGMRRRAFIQRRARRQADAEIRARHEARIRALIA